MTTAENSNPVTLTTAADMTSYTAMIGKTFVKARGLSRSRWEIKNCFPQFHTDEENPTPEASRFVARFDVNQFCFEGEGEARRKHIQQSFFCNCADFLADHKKMVDEDGGAVSP